MPDVRVQIERRAEGPGGYIYKVELLAPLYLHYGEIEELRDCLFALKCNGEARAVDDWLDRNDRR